MDRMLGPLPNWKVRWIVFGVVVIAGAVVLWRRVEPGTLWIGGPAAIAMVAWIVGSAREARIVGTDLVVQQVIAFVPLQPQRCKLKFVVEVDAQNRKDVGGADWLLFGGFNWFMDRIMQWVWPWMAGELELWVVTARDKRLLAWSGNSDADFQANLATLTSATGASVKRR